MSDDREKWLNGWHRMGSGVIMGTGVYCVGCGTFEGITCVCVEEGYQWPENDPCWPFNADDCPLCNAFARTEPPTHQQLEKASDSMLRMELIRRKKLTRKPEGPAP